MKECKAPDANSHPKAPGPPQLNLGSNTTTLGDFLVNGENMHNLIIIIIMIYFN